MEHGANPNVVDHNGSSPLHLASWTGDYEIVDMLISINNAGNGNNGSGNNNSQTNDNSAKRTIADINLKVFFAINLTLIHTFFIFSSDQTIFICTFNLIGFFAEQRQ